MDRRYKEKTKSHFIKVFYTIQYKKQVYTFNHFLYKNASKEALHNSDRLRIKILLYSCYIMY